MGDLFEVKTVKGFDEGTLKLTEQELPNSIEFVGRTRNNNGIKGYLEELAIKPNPQNVISISQIGTIVAQFRKKKWYASQNIFLVSPKETTISLISLFSVALINKSLSEVFSDGYGNYPTLAKLKNLKVKIPLQKNKIDFDFMEEFITDIEANRIAKLEAYLLASGLKEYILTEEEEQVLDNFENGKIEFREFKYKDIFNEIAQGRRLKKDDQIVGTIPFVMAGRTNTGVVNYISNPVASFPKNSITVDIFGNTFYRDYSFGAGDDTGVYWNSEKDYSKESMLFFTTTIEKSVLKKFDFGKKLRSSQSLDFKMQLPSKNKTPNYKLMQTLISAIQKLVIKDVVMYTEKKLNIAK